MHILLVSLTEKANTGARTIQISKVIRSLQQLGCFVSLITVYNEHLEYVDQSRCCIHLIPASKTKKSSFKKQFYRLRNYWLKLFPMQKKTIRLGIDKALEVIAANKPDVFFTSSNPVDSHVVGLSLNKKINIPWIASFSDPRPINMIPPPYGSKRKVFTQWLEKYYLTKVLSSCMYVHMPSVYYLEVMDQFYEIDLNIKTITIPPIGENIYKIKNSKSNGYLVNLGRMERRLSINFLKAVKEFHVQFKDKFKGVMFVGRQDSALIEMVEKMNMCNCVDFKDQVEHGKALELIGESSGILIIEADMEKSCFLPSKFAEAAYSGKPLLVVTPQKSKMRDYLDKYGGGIAVTHSKEDVIRGLEVIFNNEVNKQLLQQEELAKQFSFKVVGNQYLNMFKRAISDHKKRAKKETATVSQK